MSVNVTYCHIACKVISMRQANVVVYTSRKSDLAQGRQQEEARETRREKRRGRHCGVWAVYDGQYERRIESVNVARGLRPVKCICSPTLPPLTIALTHWTCISTTGGDYSSHWANVCVTSGRSAVTVCRFRYFGGNRYEIFGGRDLIDK